MPVAITVKLNDLGTVCDATRIKSRSLVGPDDHPSSVDESSTRGDVDGGDGFDLRKHVLILFSPKKNTLGWVLFVCRIGAGRLAVAVSTTAVPDRTLLSAGLPPSARSSR